MKTNKKKVALTPNPLPRAGKGNRESGAQTEPLRKNGRQECLSHQSWIEMTDKNVCPAEIYVNSSRAVNRGREVWLEVPAEEEVEFEAGFEFVEVGLFCEVEAQDGHVPESDAGAESKGAVEAFEFVVPSGADVEE